MSFKVLLSFSSTNFRLRFSSSALVQSPLPFQISLVFLCLPPSFPVFQFRPSNRLVWWLCAMSEVARELNREFRRATDVLAICTFDDNCNKMKKKIITFLQKFENNIQVSFQQNYSSITAGYSGIYLLFCWIKRTSCSNFRNQFVVVFVFFFFQ